MDCSISFCEAQYSSEDVHSDKNIGVDGASVMQELQQENEGEGQPEAFSVCVCV